MPIGSKARSRPRPRPRRPGKTETETPATAEQDAEEDAERGPQRRCIVTRAHGRREEMIRFVVGPDRQLVPDLAARLPGRGIWLSARRDVLETARAKGAFARAARGPVTLPPDLPMLLQHGLAQRIGELLGLARRAGQAVCGSGKVREWLVAGRAGLLMQASDGSVAERTRIAGTTFGSAVVAPLPAAMLGAVFGRAHVVHVAVRPGRLAEALATECARLRGVRGDEPDVVDGIACGRLDDGMGEAQARADAPEKAAPRGGASEATDG